MRPKKREDRLVILGKAGHAEVVGLIGQTDNEVILTNGIENLDKINYKNDVHLFSQTTMSVSDYKQLAETISIRMKENGIEDPEKHLHVNKTICGQVSNRQPGLKVFARKHDIVIFVSGKESSNGKMLYSICKSENPETFFISSSNDLKKEWFRGKKSVGICGATSTPKWLIDSIRDIISTF